jgi:hypothetical protein
VQRADLDVVKDGPDKAVLIWNVAAAERALEAAPTWPAVRITV